MTIWQTTRFDIDLSQPRIMGIVNVTPDSFSDGGQYLSAQAALQQCERLVREGADILDIGGESSRPGAPTLSPEEEWARLAEVLKVAVSLGVPVSVDTCKTEVMRRALDVGVDIINDIRALEAPGAEAVVASHARCGVCLMHMQGDPATMQYRPSYPDVVSEVKAYLARRLDALLALGVHSARITMIRVSVSGRRRRTISSCYNVRKRCLIWGALCCSGGRANRRWSTSRGGLSMSAWWPAWLPRWRRSAGELALCGCTTSQRLQTR